MSLSSSEIERYKRQLALPNFSHNKQELLKKSKVFVVGAGGLGSPIIAYLVAAGVGTIYIADDDQVNLSNLQRQVLYREKDLGKGKALLASSEANALNGEVNAIAIEERITAENIFSLTKDCHLLIDACDNLTTRYFLDEASLKNKIPYLYGAVEGYTGQISLFHYGESKLGYKNIFPIIDREKEKQEIPVLGSVAGTMGCLMATEALKVLLGEKPSTSGKLLLFDALKPSIDLIELPDI